VTFRPRIALAIALAVLASTPACSGCATYRRCGTPDPAALAALPERLSETGLFVAAEPDRIAPDVRAYEPAFPLWSDGAAKRRWVSLPSGARIDTSDPDAWMFPVGSRFWKEFSRDGRRIETRLLIKQGPAPGDWAGAAYVWNDEQTDALLAPGGLKDAHGSGHDVPSAADCKGCHGGRRSHVLGFSAVQLAGADLPLSLDELGRAGHLTQVPQQSPTVPGSALDRAALGYLHANCGHCHNRERPPRGDGPRCYDPERSLDFWLSSNAGSGDVRHTRAYESSVPRFVSPGEPDESRLLTLVSRRGWRLHMPPLASREVDTEGVHLLRAWIESLAPSDAEPASAAATP
jgi:hypothetical protein